MLFSCSSTAELLGGKYLIEKLPNPTPGKQMYKKGNT